MNSKISVITVCWNCVNDIECTIKSVLEQTYSNIEYIIIDGASTDGTLEIIGKYKNDISKIISEPDKGIYNAMNKGVELATGQWCVFMNAGDKFASNTAINDMFAVNHPESKTKVYYGDTSYRYETRPKLSLKALTVYPTILRCQPYCHQSAFFNMQEKHMPFFNEDYKIVSDYNTSLWYYAKYGKNAFQHKDVLISEFTAYGGASTLKENDKKKIEEYLDIWKHYKICHKRYLIEKIKYFIIYQQPISLLKKILIAYSKAKITQQYCKRTIE